MIIMFVLCCVILSYFMLRYVMLGYALWGGGLVGGRWSAVGGGGGEQGCAGIY